MQSDKRENKLDSYAYQENKQVFLALLVVLDVLLQQRDDLEAASKPSPLFELAQPEDRIKAVFVVSLVAYLGSKKHILLIRNKCDVAFQRFSFLIHHVKQLLQNSSSIRPCSSSTSP